MLPYEPETIAEMKARFPAAVAEPVDFEAVLAGRQPFPSNERKHVFDFADGMRMVVSSDETCGKRFMHVSSSGNGAYAKSLGDQGLDGFVEDVMLRVSAMLGKSPDEMLKAVLTRNGVLHIIFGEQA